MQIVKRYPGRALAAVLMLAMTAACTDKAGGPAGPGGPTPPTAPPGTPVTVQALACTANVKGKSVSCGVPRPGTPGSDINADVLIGNQDVFVTLTSTNVNYSDATQQFTFDVTVRNLIPQPLGTENATTLAPAANGVRVFFHNGPNVTSGTGVITVVGDGIETFTGSGQPYYQYNTVLEQYELSAPKTWTLTVPPTVNTFDFLLFVSTPVPYPNGWIEVDGNSSIRSGTTRQLTAVARTRVGIIIPDPGPITWTTADGNLATVNTTGLVKGLRAGTVAITATDPSGRTGSRPMNVLPIRRIWIGTADSNWQNGNNWLPDSIVPVATDTAYVHADSVTKYGGTQYPTLTANASVGGVEVFAAPAKISLTAFDLTATGDVFAEFLPSPGVIDNTTGRLILAGTARTVRGTLPRVLVTGTYSLTGNINTRAPLQVNAGRLTNGTFRIQTVSN